MRYDSARLVRRVFRSSKLPQRRQTAVGRRIVVEQNLLRSITRLDVQQRVQSLHRLTGNEDGAVEPVTVCFPLTQVASNFSLQRPRDVAEQTARDGDGLRHFDVGGVRLRTMQ